MSKGIDFHFSSCTRDSFVGLILIFKVSRKADAKEHKSKEKEIEKVFYRHAIIIGLSNSCRFLVCLRNRKLSRGLENTFFLSVCPWKTFAYRALITRSTYDGSSCVARSLTVAAPFFIIGLDWKNDEDIRTISTKRAKSLSSVALI